MTNTARMLIVELVAHVILEWVPSQTLVSPALWGWGVCLFPPPPQLGVPCQPGGWHLVAGQPVSVDRLVISSSCNSSLQAFHNMVQLLYSNEMT